VSPSEALVAVLTRAEGTGWAGRDPYDALLSPLGRAAIPFGSAARTLVTQMALRVPAARPLCSAPATANAKGLALFLGAVARGRRVLGADRSAVLGTQILSALALRAIPVRIGRAWGYPFPWQSRWFWAPFGTPNAVVTATVGWHALDYADAFEDADGRRIGRDAAEFLAEGLAMSELPSGAAALAYTPNDRTRIVNVSALGARLLARVGETGPARRLLKFILGAQRLDGSWRYAEDPRGGWEDSFHTGFVLEALLDLRRFGLEVPDESLEMGFFSYARFFDDDGSARLTPKPGAPRDAHSAAQGIVTYAALVRSPLRALASRVGARERAGMIAQWALQKLYLPNPSYFAYRILRGVRDERDFTRWVQAWMALAMATASDLQPDGAVEAISMDREQARVGV
jgi:hypothetical protein